MCKASSFRALLCCLRHMLPRAWARPEPPFHGQRWLKAPGLPWLGIPPQSFWLLLGPEEPLDKVSFENPRRLNDGITVHGKLLFLPFCKKKKQGYAPDKFNDDHRRSLCFFSVLLEASGSGGEPRKTPGLSIDPVEALGKTSASENRNFPTKSEDSS